VNRLCLRAIAITATIALVLGRGDRAAEAAEGPEPTVIELSVMPAQDKRGKDIEGEYWVMATLTTVEGRYVAERAVEIVEPIDFFGRREASLGTAATDGTGLAAVMYLPAQAGQHQIVARFAGDAEYAASEDELLVDVAEAISPFPEEAPPLESVGTWLSVTLAILGVAFWAVLLGVLGSTVWRIRTAPAKVGGRPAQEGEGVIAEAG
jgi:hypothetical protein